MLYIGFAIISGLIHCLFFLLESVLWGKDAVNKIFRLTNEQANSNQILAFNQGFYNLFLAFGSIGGAILIHLNMFLEYAQGILIFSNTCMLGAAIILLLSDKKFWRASLIQGLPPLCCLLSFLLLN